MSIRTHVPPFWHGCRLTQSFFKDSEISQKLPVKRPLQKHLKLTSSKAVHVPPFKHELALQLLNWTKAFSQKLPVKFIGHWQVEAPWLLLGIHVPLFKHRFGVHVLVVAVAIVVPVTVWRGKVDVVKIGVILLVWNNVWDSFDSWIAVVKIDPGGWKDASDSKS